MLIEFLHTEHYIGFEIPRSLSLVVIVVIFAAAWIYARAHERPQSGETAGGADQSAKGDS
jgi:hypothetical protein